MGLVLGKALEFYTSVAKGLKLKVRKFLGLTPTFVEVTGEKLIGWGDFLPHPVSILNTVNSVVQLLVQNKNRMNYNSMVQSDEKIKHIVFITFPYHRGISSNEWNNCNMCVTVLKFMV